MKLKPINRRGFTLVEILVVIAIIATLGAISIPIGMRMLNSAYASQSKAQMKEFLAANKNYKADYGCITADDPSNWRANTDIGGRNNNAHCYTSNHGSGVLQSNQTGWSRACTSNGWKHFRALTGWSVSYGYNPKRIRYLTMAYAKNDKGGLVAHSDWGPFGMVDAWGRRFTLLIDYDADHKFNRSAGWMEGYSGLDLDFGSDHMGLVSPGADGILDGEDDVVSWQ